MIIKSDKLCEYLDRDPLNEVDPFVVVPTPELSAVRATGAASLDLRLGRWFLALRQTRTTHFDFLNENHAASDERILSRKYFVPFGGRYILHPGRFVLGATLEWLRVPPWMAAYITGRSSLGRRGLIIETAAGIHPGFFGCVTLELTNLGEVPIAISPGMKICQIFFHRATESDTETRSRLSGSRRPTISPLSADEVLAKLIKRREPSA